MKYDSSAYYRKIIRVFTDSPDEGTKRAYVTAIGQCFDLNGGKPHDPRVVAHDHGFQRKKIHELGFVLAKAHATEFFVESVKLPGVTAKDIRDVGVELYTERLSRDPFIRGRSSYWFSVSEWIFLLETRGDLLIPSPLVEFAANHSIRIPGKV